ncbi:acyl-CoA dehydrogenase family protein [Nocardia alni]|uniref:acyl-CoA dehydrogenase family protein n=1 Tax=Nocardia alni TaxID=2815723 RepID=UPI001C22129E|nr:acyl-CoA dehydrogenase family protein [Nocardia alni]
MDAADVAQVADSLRQALTCAPADADEVLTGFGWDELLDDEPRVAVSTLFPLCGELLTTGSALDRVLLRAAGIEGLPPRTHVVLPALGGHRPSGRYDRRDTVNCDGVAQTGEGPLLVPCVDPQGELLFAVGGQVGVAEGNPIDPTAGWVRIRGTMPVHTVLDADALGEDPGQVWQRMLAAGRRALAYELVAVGTAMETMTVEHVRGRHQFGQSLGSFQAVKHQLADVHLWRAVAQLAAEAAWEDGGPDSAALAKAAAVRCTKTARAVCQQLLGGMGFTWEHDFHRYLRRALTLEPLLGGQADLHAELGAALRAGSISDSLAALGQAEAVGQHTDSKLQEEQHA